MAHITMVRSEWVGPSSWLTWIGSHTYAVGAYVVPNPANGHYYKCTTAGTSDASAPTWPTTHGATVSDGSVVWTCEYTTAILASELAALDANQQAALNGVDGSTHAPTAAIVIGGAGLHVTGPLKIARGGTFTVTAAGGIVLAAGNVPQYGPRHQGRTATDVHALVGGRPARNGTWRVRHADCGVQAVAPTMDFSDGAGPQVARWAVPLRVRDAATITSLTVALRVGAPHATLPTKMPGVRLLRFPSSGIPQPMTSIASGADPSGFVYVPQPASAASWTGQQTLAVPVDQNNVVDIGNYTYALEIIEEQWSQWPGYPFGLIVKQPVRLATTPGTFAVNPHGAGYAIDEITVNVGDRVLVKDVGSASASGIYIAATGSGSAGDWTPAPDFAAPTDFTQGVIVPVQLGTMNGGSYWQAATTMASWAGPLTTPPIVWTARGPDDDATPVNKGTEFFGKGNVFQAAAISYAGITEQVFQ
ncbi:MAG TPA: hypothetical protein VGG39_08815 [Polyangiaceae bacterium]|jgi:hypothetical protein